MLKLAPALVVLGGSICCASVAQAGAPIPDGIYECSMMVGSSLMSTGDIEIKGSTYRGPAFDDKFEGTYNYVLTDGGVILWKGPMGGFDTGGNSIASTVVVSKKDPGAMFRLTVKSDAGNFHTVECGLRR